MEVFSRIDPFSWIPISCSTYTVMMGSCRTAATAIIPIIFMIRPRAKTRMQGLWTRRTETCWALIIWAEPMVWERSSGWI